MNEARNIAEDLLEALKLMRNGQTVAMLLCNELGLSQRVYDVLSRHVEDCQKVLDKYPNL